MTILLYYYNKHKQIDSFIYLYTYIHTEDYLGIVEGEGKQITIF